MINYLGEGNDIYHIQVRDSEVKVLDSSGENHYYLKGSFNLSNINIYWYNNAVSIISPTTSQDPNAVLPQFKLTFFDDHETQPTVDGGLSRMNMGIMLRVVIINIFILVKVYTMKI